MQRTKPIGERVPIPNKTRIPDATHERVGYQISGSSHHFHRPCKISKKKNFLEEQFFKRKKIFVI